MSVDLHLFDVQIIISATIIALMILSDAEWNPVPHLMYNSSTSHHASNNDLPRSSDSFVFPPREGDVR